MFFAMIADPASPKPKASSAPILLKVDSNIAVSIGPEFLSLAICFAYISAYAFGYF